jgi:hypothetical protein
MAAIAKAHVLEIIRRAYGPDVATSLADRLPESVDLENTADLALLSRLGINRERLIDELGGAL